jgi:aminoglycoside phosphotransferase (APT) family kinase protein
MPSSPLVLRLYDRATPVEQLRLEQLIQNAVAAQGGLAPRVLVACEDPAVIGSMFVLVERVPGRPVLDTRWHRFAARFPAVCSTWPAQFCLVLDALHAVDGEQVVAFAQAAGLRPDQLSCDRHLATVTRELARYEEEGFAEVIAWLTTALPPEPSRPVVAHGDLWPANVLTENGRLSGLVDWNRAGVGHPALDVGFAKAGLALMPAPYAAPPPFKQLVNRAGVSLAQRVAAASDLNSDDIDAFEALRCLVELADVAAHPASAPVPWKRATEDLVRHLRDLTGLPLRVPAALRPT